MIAATFWLTKFDNNVTILQVLLNTGALPSIRLSVLAAHDHHLSGAYCRRLDRSARGELGLGQIVFFLGYQRTICFFLLGSNNRPKKTRARPG